MLNQNSGLVIWKEKGNSYYNYKEFKRAVDCYNQILQINQQNFILMIHEIIVFSCLSPCSILIFLLLLASMSSGVAAHYIGGSVEAVVVVVVVVVIVVAVVDVTVDHHCSQTINFAITISLCSSSLSLSLFCSLSLFLCVCKGILSFYLSLAVSLFPSTSLSISF